LPQIVSEIFTDRHQSLPAVSVVQVGDFRWRAPQVVIESISVAKKDANRNGLIFISGRLPRMKNRCSR